MYGRIQTRLFLILGIGGVWAVLISPLLPLDGTLGDKYLAMYSVLLIVAVLGVLWEFVYHGLQQFRWEKDWPTLFGLLLAVPEGVVAFAVARTGVLPAAEHVTWAALRRRLRDHLAGHLAVRERADASVERSLALPGRTVGLNA